MELPLKVVIYHLVERGGDVEDQVAGELLLIRGEVRVWAAPGNTRLMQNIVKRRVYDPRVRHPWTAKDNPVEWMHALRFQYTSPYLRATEAMPVGEECDLSPEDEKILDRVWDDIVARGGIMADRKPGKKDTGG